ncbi:MAG: TonB-dependent receptor [Bacteroidota bacterium]|nr:TonB-dependent receptor [Bacteroidota bacterium]
MKGYKLACFIICCGFSLSGQQKDSVELPELTVTSYLSSRPIFRVPASVSIVDSTMMNQQSRQSLVPLLNTIPGLRMEERSPGSYRLSLRGSLLRSPFGIRNVKIYLDEFPLTDAGGNTYLNLLDVNCIHQIEVLKGPDGSLFGANSGGVLKLISRNTNEINEAELSTSAGSYGLFRQHFSIQRKIGKSVFSLSESWQRSDGYRKHTSFDRKYFQIGNRWMYSPRAELKLFAFYSDLKYETPGGLTKQQWEEDPRSARPATKTLPGAEEQKAGIMNRTLFAGISHKAELNRFLRHVISVSSSYTDFKNPFITNYEERNETTGSVRTFLEAANDKEASFADLTFNIGGEMQQTNSRFRNYKNEAGTKGEITVSDQLNAGQSFLFSRLMIDLFNRLVLEGALSLNFSRYQFKGIYPVITNFNNRRFEPRLMPRLALSWRLASFVTWRASVSKGYSVPTVAEIRSSDNTINTDLQPEEGWSYETGFRLISKNGRAHWDASVFYYRLQNAIVRRINANDEEYFINAGNTSQPGLESDFRFGIILPRDKGFFRKVELKNSWTVSKFTFENYTSGETDFSGNKLTGVPEQVVVTGVDAHFPYRISVYAQHMYVSSLPLNDANTESANAYQLVQMKISWRAVNTLRLRLDLFFGADNLLNETYSSGNDLNAFGGRYFNTSPNRNWFGGIRCQF